MCLVNDTKKFPDFTDIPCLLTMNLYCITLASKINVFFWFKRKYKTSELTNLFTSTLPTSSIFKPHLPHEKCENEGQLHDL